jgi:hypothetical protein
MKGRVRTVVALGLTSLLSVLVLLVGHTPGLAVNGFSPNQELWLPLTAGHLAVRFVVRGLEPSTRVAPDGTVYISSIRGVPGGVDLHRSYPPLDGGPNPDGTYNFKYQGRPDGCGIFAFGCELLGVAEGGGDVDIAVNYPTGGSVPNLALTSLTLAPGITATHSTDRGDTFTNPNPVAAVIPGDDRMWMDGTGAKTVYLAYHDVATFNIEVQRSNDGGQTYVDGFGEAIDPQTFPATGGLPPTNTANIAASIRVDRSQCPSRGNLYQLFVAPETAAENVTGGPFRSVYVGVSSDVKLGLPVFTFTDYKVFTGPVGANFENIFPALAVDNVGTLYAVWSDNSVIFYSFSRDLGASWAPPVDLTRGTATAGKANVFPWIDADANGHVGVVWFGADRAGDSNDRTVMEPGHIPSQGAACNDGTTTCMTRWANWHVYYAETVNGYDRFGPAFTVSQISDHVIHRGTISTGGLGGGADRSLADYFQIAFDPNHRANVAFSDDHKVNTEVGPDNGPDNPTTRRLIRANFTHQLEPNPNIAIQGSCTAGPPQGDRDEGQGQDKDQDSFAFIDRSSPANGTLVYRDLVKGLSVRSSNGVQTVTYSGGCVVLTGAAKANDQPGYRFTFTACPAPAGTGLGSFTVALTGPLGFSYQKGGALTQGYIKLHTP